MRLCKDCKFFFEDTSIVGNYTAVCQHPQSERYDDPVYGNHTKHSCRTMRDNKMPCGMTGKLWLAAADFTPTEYPLL